MIFSQSIFSLSGNFTNWLGPKWREKECEDGITDLTIVLTARRKSSPEPFTLEFLLPRRGAVGRWTPGADRTVKYLAPDWDGSFETDLALLQPTVCFFAEDGTNSATFALSEVGRRLKINAGIRGDGMLRCRINFFCQPEAPLEHYRFAMRIDRRKRPFHQVLRETAEWYEALPEFRPPLTPETAWEPVFSSWYAYQQNICDHELEAECVPAHAAGMTTLIVDDGWQTEEGNGGYAYCGDWKPAKRRFPEMRRHVERVHALGMRYLLWYSVPFIGIKSGNFERFQGKFLYCREDLGAWVLDPRFPEVRAFLVTTYERALCDWKLDGFKLDFIDCFSLGSEDPAVAENYVGRDFRTVPEAVERLLSEIIEKLHRIRPDVLLEFRQPYFGPAMRRCGNLFRAGDCPNDLISNRLRTVDMRLCCGSAPVHSDMVCWSPEETPEEAAAQLLNVLFSVPQISVRMGQLPETHRRMLTFWLKFWRKNHHTLMRGEFQPELPQWNYPLVSAENSQSRITVLYSPGLTVPVALHSGQAFRLVNASGSSRVTVEWCGTPRQARCFNTLGDPVGCIRLEPGIQVIDIPISGLLQA